MAKQTNGMRAAAYARYSSDMQREESIDAQLRAIQAYADSNGYVLVKTYIDRAKSATTDKRPEFLQMIKDAQAHGFDAIIVHKLDRFSRDRYNSAIYRHKLKLSGVTLLSVTERLDGSPESVIMESVIEAMAEYYSLNLAREVTKGLRENALSGRHVGGRAPLGYDVDPSTRLLIINEREAASVRLIFKMYLAGCGYGEIIDALNGRGYRTKRGQPFSKTSLYEILRNEKYTGVYVYNKSAAKNAEGKFNRHAYKSEDEIIRIEGLVPQIVTPEDFETVQRKMAERRHKAAKYTAKETYLLSGKIICGECGSSFIGNSQRADATHPQYVSYRCTRRNGAVKCTNPSVRREALEQAVTDYISDRLFDESLLPQLIKSYEKFLQEKNREVYAEREQLLAKTGEIDRGIGNIVDVIVNTGSRALTEKLRELETQKAALNIRLNEINAGLPEFQVARVAAAFRKGKQMLKSGSAKSRQAIIQQYVDRIIVNREDILCSFIPLPQMNKTVPFSREAIRTP